MPAWKVPKKHWTTTIGQATGHPAAFGVVLLYALGWLVFDPVSFDWNAVATLAVDHDSVYSAVKSARHSSCVYRKPYPS
jgi:hypothetical protein